MKLFEVEAGKKEKREETCRTCKHRQRWEYDDNGKILQYCGIRKSNRTMNGLLKIKCKNEACILYQKINNKNSSK